jgi:hypothetical protein
MQRWTSTGTVAGTTPTTAKTPGIPVTTEESPTTVAPKIPMERSTAGAIPAVMRFHAPAI